MAARNNYVGQLKEKGSVLASDIKDIGSVFRSAASDKYGQLKDGAASMGRNAKDAVNGYVTRSPWRAMMIAAGTGLVAGWFLRRK